MNQLSPNNDLNVRMAPHSQEAEEAVLGSILIDPAALYRVMFLSGDDFFLVKNQWVWEAIVALGERREPIDFLTVCEELDRRGQLAEIGGPAYVSHLINVVPTAIHAEGYAHIVEQTSIRRKLLAAASDIAQLAYEESEDVAEQVDQAHQAIFNLRARRNGNTLEPLPALIADYYKQLEWRYEHPDELPGLPTGFVILDKLLGGLQKTDLIVVAGRPGCGKTSLLLNIALNAVRRFKQRVAIFSLEMSRPQVIERLLAQESGIDSQKLRTGRLAEEDWPRFVEAVSSLSADERIWIDDTPAISALQLHSKARRHCAYYGLDLVVVDYLQRMTANGQRGNRTQEVSYLARSLKTLAGELSVPVLVAAQISRAVEQRADKRPVLSDLRESGDIENEADVVAFVYQDEIASTNADAAHGATEIIIAKHRKGPTGTVPLYFHKHLTRFVDAQVRQVQL